MASPSDETTISSANNTQPDSACGATVREAVAAADKALAAKDDPHGQTLALRCLLQAVKGLAAAQPVITRGADQHELLHVPDNPGGPGAP